MTIVSPNSGKVLQAKFFEKIKDTLPGHVSLVDEIADLLGLSNDSVYRRIRGETSLTIEEIAAISDHFKISFDLFSELDAASVNFNYGFLRNEQGFKEYLTSILNDMQRFKESNTELKEVIYSANDMPIFYQFNYPELASFKIFYWLKSILDLPNFKDQKYDASLINQELIDIGKQIYELYCTLPSIEIWTEDTINSHVKQIEFYWDAGYVGSKEVALQICSQARKIIQNLELNTEKGFKNSGENEADFSFYLSEIEIGNNCILMKLGDIRAVYLSFHTFNKITTSNQRFCKETELWLDNIIRKSILISGTSSKYRYQFFKKMYEKFDRLIAKIENS